MGMQNKLSAVALYLVAIFILYGRTEVLPTDVYKHAKDRLSEAKRDTKLITTFYKDIAQGVGTQGSMKKYADTLKT